MKKAGRIEEGLEVLEEAFDQIHRNGDQYYLAEVYRLQKKTDQARDTFERGLGAAALAWGPSDPRLPDWMERLAATLRQQEDYAGAEELEIRATRIRVLHTIR